MVEGKNLQIKKKNVMKIGCWNIKKRRKFKSNRRKEIKNYKEHRKMLGRKENYNQEKIKSINIRK